MSIRKDIRQLAKDTSAKGMEKAVLLVQVTATMLLYSLRKVFEGKPLPPGKKHKNPLDKGIVPILRDVSAIDLCNILTYLVNKTPSLVKKIPMGADKKDGSNDKSDSTKKDTRPKTEFEKALQYVQDKAYDAQKLIDKYYYDFTDRENLESKFALFALTRDIKKVLNEALQTGSAINQQLPQAIPQLQSYQSFIQNSIAFFDKYTDINSISQKDVKKIMSYIDKTRAILVAIQSFDGEALSSITSILLQSPKIQEEINKINRIVKPERLLPFIKKIQEVCVAIQKQANLLISIITKAQTLINTIVIIIKVLQIVIKLIKALIAAIPAMFMTAGTIEMINDKIKKQQDKLKEKIKRLEQLNKILQIILYVIGYIVGQIEEILQYLKIIILNLENCNYADPDIVKDLKDTVKSLEDTRDTLNSFKSNYENNKQKTDNTFGDEKNKYTIQIITEQVVDDAIRLKRRYGIALDKNGVLAVSSTPTFASQDSIIIDEVKLILVSKKLVNPELSELSSENISIINESLNFLQDDEISLEDFLNESITNFSTKSEELDDPDNEDEEKGIGLNAFTNKLNGGKKLRNRVRKRLAVIASNFKKKKSSDKVEVKKKFTDQASKNKEIERLQTRRAELVKEREDALKSGPAGASVASAKTKEIQNIDAQIAELKK